MDSMMEFIMIGNHSILQSNIAILRKNNPGKVFVLYKGCIIQISEEYARANNTTKEFKNNIVKFVNSEGIKRCENGSLNESEIQTIIDSDVEKIIIM